MKTNNKPSVLRSCTAAAHAADAHAQESANWAEVARAAFNSALNAAEAANNSAERARRLTADMQSAFRRLTIDVILSSIASAIALSVSVIALYHAA